MNKAGRSVFTVTSALAYALVLVAGGGKPPTNAENHGIGKIGFYWHYHPYGHTSSHVWYLF